MKLLSWDNQSGGGGPWLCWSGSASDCVLSRAAMRRLVHMIINIF